MGKYGKACWFRGCPSRSMKHPAVKFFPFIKPWLDLPRCERWIAASGRDEPKEHISKHSYVCGKHFLNGAPSAECPDPLPLPFYSDPLQDHDARHEREEQANINELNEQANTFEFDEQGNVLPSEQPIKLELDEQANTLGSDEQANRQEPAKSPEAGCALSPEHQAALALKEKTFSLRKAIRLMQAPYQKPNVRLEVPVIHFPPGNVCSSGSTNDNASMIVVPKEESSSFVLHREDVHNRILNPGHASQALFVRKVSSPFQLTKDGCSPMAPLKQTWISHGRLFGKSMRIDDSSNDNKGGTRLRNVSTDTSDLAPSFEKFGRRSISTQTMSKSHVNRLIAGGKLSKWESTTSRWASDEDDLNVDGHGQENADTPLRRVITSKVGVRVMIVEPPVEDDGDASKQDNSKPNEAGSSSKVSSSSLEGQTKSVECHSASVDNASMESEDSHEDTSMESDDADTEHDQENTGRARKTKSRAMKPDGKGETTGRRDQDKVPSKQKRTGRKIFLSCDSLTDSDFEYLCGLTREKFGVLYNYLGGDEVCSKLIYEKEKGIRKQFRVSNLNLHTRLFITLFRLRRGLPEKMLAILFGCSEASISRIVTTWINHIFVKFQPQEDMLLDRKNQKRELPKIFKCFNELI